MIRGTWLALVLAGCGGSCPEAESAASAPPSSAEEHAPKADADAAEAASESAPKKTEGDEKFAPSGGDSAKKDDVVDPEFPENATVSQAMAAVPQGTSRANIDPERLGEPLQVQSVYEPCKVGGQHFKLKVAIWNGHAVGVDVSTPSKALASCIERQVRGVQWQDKVRSLNTVEYSM